MTKAADARLEEKSNVHNPRKKSGRDNLWHNLGQSCFGKSQHCTISVVALAGPADLCGERATRGRARTIRLGIQGPDCLEYGAWTSLGPNYTSDDSDYSRPGLVGLRLGLL